METENKLREYLASVEKLYSPTHEYTKAAAYRLAEFYAGLERMADADQVLDWMSEKLVQNLGLTHEKTADHFLHISRLFDTWFRRTDSNNFLNDVVAAYDQAHLENKITPLGRATPRVGRHRILLAPPYERQRNNDDDNPQPTLTEDPASVDYHISITDAQNKDEMAVALERARKAFWTSIDSESERSEAFFHDCMKIAKIQLVAGRVDLANDISERVGNEVESTFGIDNMVTIQFYIHIGKDFQTNDRWPEAQLWFERALCASMASDRKCKLVSCMTRQLEEALENQHHSDSVSEIDNFVKIPSHIRCSQMTGVYITRLIFIKPKSIHRSSLFTYICILIYKKDL